MPLAAIPIAEAHALPRWRRPEAFLMLMAVASPLAFATWMALLNNFVVERAAFDGFDIKAGLTPQAPEASALAAPRTSAIPPSCLGTSPA